MSFPAKKLSPLDGLQRKTDSQTRTEDQSSEILILHERSDSVVSYESIKTTERLLDRLELSPDDEALLQQALKENEVQTISGSGAPEKRVVCVPASGFPSLRKLSGSSGSSNTKEMAPFMNILSELSQKEKIKLSKLNEVELHMPQSRYSYLVEEDSGEDTDDFLTSRLAPDGRAISFERYRMKVPPRKSSSASLINQPNIETTPRIIPQYALQKDGHHNSLQTPMGSTSSLETKVLIKPSTHSSMESERSQESDKNRSGDKPPSWKFSTPQKFEPSFTADESPSPTKARKGHKKKTSFSLKSLFKSPKVESPKAVFSQVQSSESTPNSTPIVSKFKFPPPQMDDIAIPSSHTGFEAPQTWNDNHKTFRANFVHLDHSRASSDSNVYVSRTDGNWNKRSAGPISSQTRNTHMPRLMRPSTQENSQSHLSKDTQVTQEARIRTAIELRNKGLLNQSAEQLKVLCDMNNPTGHLLYGLALRYGSGVEVDYLESFKHLKLASGVHSEERELFSVDIDPFKLHNVPHVPREPQAPALYECGISYLKGYGVNEIDEVKGLKYLEKAASNGHLDSMCLSGTIWSKSSKVRRKNMTRAAAWFRLADRRGADLIGADWIYKDKYQNRSIESL
ncbi:LADA_0F05864g1_1 [Lachancea dasiensis]|uniref:LADA_0F05864g1_1 n=1 Tax=Lachancea dasiensis TaxID=1072105 RepID=A0A1G4JKA4_9SACH|nr:LADA_0F05864g1_1 [Lachancea dasiensis]